jgi:transposase-like protein
MFVKMNDKDHYLWRALDQDGYVLDILVQSRRNKKAAKRFFRKLLKGLQCVPRVIVTDKLKSYNAAKAEIIPGVEHRQHKGLKDRAIHQAWMRQVISGQWGCSRVRASDWCGRLSLPPKSSKNCWTALVRFSGSISR